MEGDDVQQGISHRTIKKIFTLLEEKSLRHLSQEHSDRFDYTVKIGMLEIYNDEGKFYFASLAASTKHFSVKCTTCSIRVLWLLALGLQEGNRST